MIRRCRACETSEFAGHHGFAQALESRSRQTGASPPEVVYLWEDLTITDLPLPQAAPIFASADTEWREFCASLLNPAG
jgi:hypothetical protein